MIPSSNSTPRLTRAWNVTSAPPHEARKKLYAEALSGKNGTRYKLTVKTKDNQSTDTVKKILKSILDPIDMKIGIRAFKGLEDGKVLIEADTTDDTEIFNSQIREKYGDRLETNVQKRRNPRLIIYNIPGEFTLENAENKICEQCSELPLTKGDISTKFIFKPGGTQET